MSGARLIVLVVEDEPSDYDLIELAVRRCKLPVDLRWVSDGAEARNYLMGEGGYSERSLFPLPHLVVTDLNMPRLTGHELIAWVRTQPAYLHLPIVVMSSSLLPHDVARAYEEGANTYFTKPSNLDQLTELCAAIVGYWGKAAHQQFGAE